MAGNNNGNKNGNGNFDVYDYLEGCARVNPENKRAYVRLEELWRDFLKGSELEVPGSNYTELDVFNERLEKVAAETGVLSDICLVLREKAAAYYARKLAKEAELQKPKALEETIKLDFENGRPYKITTVGKTTDVWSFIPESYKSLWELCEGENKVDEFLRFYETAKGLEPKLVQKEGIAGIFNTLTAPESCKMFKDFLEKNRLDEHVKQQGIDDPIIVGTIHEEASRKVLQELIERVDYCTKQNPTALHYVTEDKAVELLKDAEKARDAYVARKQQKPAPIVVTEDNSYGK